jgi:multidrug efflux system membrane fusion protein
MTPTMRPAVTVAASDGASLGASAELAFADNRLGTGTGTMRLRARVTNAPQLAPGGFVRVTLAFPSERPALLIDERAVGVDQDKRFVLVVDGDGNVAYRQVELGARHGTQRVVTQGLATDDRVVVDGLAYARPGMKVTPQQAAADAANAPSRLAALKEIGK